MTNADKTIERLRQVIRELRGVNTENVRERKERATDALTHAAREIKAIDEERAEHEERAWTLHRDLDEAKAGVAERDALIEMIYDVERRTVTPRELVEYVKETYYEDGTRK